MEFCAFTGIPLCYSYAKLQYNTNFTFWSKYIGTAQKGLQYVATNICSLYTNAFNSLDVVRTAHSFVIDNLFVPFIQKEELYSKFDDTTLGSIQSGKFKAKK